MMNLPSAHLDTDRSVFGVAIVLSLAMSVWCAYAQQIPNPDALYYLRAAEFFQAGQWAQGFAVYRWPFLSLSIAGAMTLTGATAPVAAQIVNAVLDGATVVIFVALAQRLAVPGSARSIAWWAMAVILLHPKVASIRSGVVRDHGFYTFFLLTIYLVVRDHQEPRSWIKLAILAAILAAALFRLEALLLLVVAPGFYVICNSPTRRRWLLAAPAALVVAAILGVIYAAWTGQVMLPGGSSGSMESDLMIRFREIGEAMRTRTTRLAEVLPPTRNAGIIGYIGYSIIALLDAALRATSVPLAILALFAFTPRRLLGDFATRVVLWFAGWQIVVLLGFTVIAYFIDWRFAMAFALIMAIPATFTVAEVTALWRARQPVYRLIFPVVLLALTIPWLLEVPRFSKLEYLRDAGYWIDRNLPPQAKVVTNDGRIAYFSGRALQSEILLRPSSEITSRNVSEADYVAVDSARNSPPPFVTQDLKSRMIATIDGANNRSVFIYKIK
jgi:hypothetical protein